MASKKQSGFSPVSRFECLEDRNVFILYLADFAVVTCQQQVRSNLKTQHVPARSTSSL